MLLTNISLHLDYLWRNLRWTPYSRIKAKEAVGMNVMDGAINMNLQCMQHQHIMLLILSNFKRQRTL